MSWMIDHYDIIELLAEGGTGKVYKAVDVSNGQLVAIKILHEANRKNKALVDQFIFEANQYLYLTHFHIPKLIHFSNQPIPYLVMEFVQGETIEYRINNVTGPMPEHMVVNIMLQLLDAIAYAHSFNVFHLDIKPSNIMIDKNNMIKVLDFGIARSKQFDNITCADGTPFYMSPEQIKKQPVTERTDVYAIGLTMFKMLCGRLPFDHQIEQDKLFEIILKGDIPSLKSIYPPVSGEAEKIVRKAISTDPDFRYASCNQFKEEIYNLV